jgi:hypothetical protein
MNSETYCYVIISFIHSCLLGLNILLTAVLKHPQSPFFLQIAASSFTPLKSN